MAETSAKLEREIVAEPELGENLAEVVDEEVARERTVARLRLLWEQRRFLLRTTALGLIVTTAMAFLIPKRYTSTTRLMPPDNQSGSGVPMLTALAGRTGPGLGTLAGSFLGMGSTGELFVGVLQSRTVQDDLINKFDLRRVYWDRRWEDARKDLSKHTDILQDRKSGIITIKVTDRNPKRAAAMAQAYVEELNRVVNQLSTSSAHRERVFLEERLQAVKQDLENAEKEFSQFASKNIAIDIKEQGKVMVEAAATLQGQLIAAQSELEGSKQIYTDNNVRVRATKARIAELRHQLKKLGGEGKTVSSESGQDDKSLYPSIRKLPLLGVTYANLYRRTKIDEAIFEALTQECELAKVEEAKDIPSVKILDPANVPEKKSFPPRLLIMFLGTTLAFAIGVGWVFGRATWEMTNAEDPRKVLAQEVWTAFRSQKLWGWRDGNPLGVSLWRGSHQQGDGKDRTKSV